MKEHAARLVVLIAGITLIAYSLTAIVGYNAKVANQYESVPFQKGMSFTRWQAFAFNTKETRQEFDTMKAAGIEWVTINHWWFQDWLNSTEIKMGYNSDSMDNITSIIQYARSIGLHVMYKPMLNLAMTYDWRSYIIYTDDWMGNYTAWMVENAKAAEAGGAEMLSIGCEMGNMQVHSDGVRAMIAQVRAVYGGLLTYSANHDSYMHIDWYDAIDMIGISMYTMMTTAWNPSIDEMVTVWNGIAGDLEELSIRWNKPVGFTEIGIQARDGSNIIPNDNQISTRRDVEEMRNYYLSLFNSRIWSAPWFKGAHWWIWDTTPASAVDTLDSFNPIIILDTITAEYTKAHVVEPATMSWVITVLPLVAGSAMLALVLVKACPAPLPGREFTFTRKQRDRQGGAGVNAVQGTVAGAITQDQHATPGPNDHVLGLLLGAFFSNVFTNLTIGLFNVVQKSVSYAIILQISTTETLVTFAALLLVAMVAGAAMFRYLPRYLLIIAFFLVMVYPYFSLESSVETIFVKTFSDLLVTFLLAGCLIMYCLKFKASNPARILLVSVIVVSAYMAGVVAFGALAQAFLAVPLGIAVLLSSNKQPDRGGDGVQEGGLAMAQRTPAWKNVGIENMLAFTSLIAGMVIPFGNSPINLIHMNELSVAVHYLPAAIVAPAVVLVYFLLDRKGRVPRWLDVKRAFSNNHLLVAGLAMAGAGFLFLLAGRPVAAWGVLSGVFFVVYAGTVISNVHEAIKRRQAGRAYVYIVVAAFMFVVGFLLNAIKGLLVYVVTFLVFKDGQLVRRDPAIDPVPNFDVPFLLNAFVLAVVIAIATIMLVYRLIYFKLAKKPRFWDVNNWNHY